MFFLRPHGRQRVSQEDSEEAAVTTNSSSSDYSGGQQHQPIRQSDLQSALAAAGIESIHQPSPSAVDSLSPSDDDNPATTNTTSGGNNIRNDPSRSSSNTNSLTPPPPAPPSATSAVLSESPSSERSELNNNATSLSEQHYPPHPAMIRTSPTCTLLLFFFLLRLWIEAIIEKDIGLIFISLMGTTWCYRWYVIRREAEREWLESANDNELSVEGTTATRTSNRSGADAAVDFDPDLGLMSFQAQLAMAILESQRQMFENGGYGGNDNPSSENGPGVTNEAKQSWTRYEWGKCGDETMEKLRAVIHKSDSKTKIGGSGVGGSGGGDDYGSVSVVDTDDTDSSQPTTTEMNENDAASSSSLSKLEEGGLLVKSLDEEEPSCSICLCEYENGETVTKLPCNHIYHESCIGSWAEHHVRCPLCNYDLMTGFEQPESVRNQQNNEAEQLAFRNMALSALGGRRIRARTSRRSGGGNRRSAARYSSALAAAEDSIV